MGTILNSMLSLNIQNIFSCKIRVQPQCTGLIFTRGFSSHLWVLSQGETRHRSLFTSKLAQIGGLKYYKLR